MPIWSGIDRFPVHNCWDLGDSSDPGFQAEFGGSASGLGPTTYMFNILNAYCSQAGSGSGFGPAGVYRAGLMDTPTTASPFKATTIWDFDLIGPVYDTLFKTNPMCSESPPPGSVPTCSSKYQLLDWMTRGHSFVCNAAVGIPCDQAHLGYTPPPEEVMAHLQKGFQELFNIQFELTSMTGSLQISAENLGRSKYAFLDWYRSTEMIAPHRRNP